jgi:hypothetical protein
MFTQSILSSSAGLVPAPSPSPGPAATGFQAALAEAQGPGVSLGAALAAPAGPVDPADEQKALVQLFHILACLSCGVVDYPVDSPASDSTPGPIRRELEALKEVLRRIMNGGSSPQGGGLKGGKVAGLSLEALYQSLPPEIRNLLLHAFPKLKDLLREEADPTAAS